jgi:hypothetical protein
MTLQREYEDSMKIDYNAIWSQKTEDAKWTALENEVERVGHVCLSDTLTHLNSGGYMMLEWLGNQELQNIRAGTEMRWKIRAIQDEWGNKYKPGDKVTRRIQKPLKDKAGRKYRSNAINDFIRRGTFEKMFIELREFVVDDKGCIDCSYDDAAWFLTEFGTHYNSGVALCGRRELSSGPCKAPDGSERHIRYWRFSEAPQEVYEQLPALKKTRKRASSPSGALEE